MNAHLPVHPISPDIADRIVARYRAGQPAKGIASDLGLLVKQVSALLEERGVKRSRSQAAALARRPPGSVAPSEWPAELAAAVLERDVAGESGEGGRAGGAGEPGYRVLGKCGVLRSRSEALRVVHARRWAAAEQEGGSSSQKLRLT